MVDIDKLLMGEDPAPRKRDRVDDILEGTTIGPATTEIPKGYAEPRDVSFGTHFQAGIVDKPQSKIEIYARELGLPKERFGVDKRGEIFYIDVDGLPKLVSEDSFGGKVKQFTADTMAHAPSLLLGGAGSIAGPWASAAGSAAGELIRKGVGKLAFGEPSTATDFAIDAAKEGALGFAGEKLGGKLISTIDLSRGKEGARLVKAAGRGRDRISIPDVQAAEAEGNAFGIRLLPPQTTRSPELISRFNLLGDLPETADVVGMIRRKQGEQVASAIDNYLGTLAPATTTPGQAGARAVEAAQAGLDAPKKAAQAASKAFYDEAKQVRGVDISGTIEKVDSMLDAAPRGSTEEAALKRIRGMITREEQDAQGKTITVAEDRVAVLDKVKKEINNMWKKDPMSAPDKEAQRSISDALEDMLTSIDTQVPAYGKARKAYGESIGESGLEELKKSKVAEIAKLQGDKVERAAKMLFSTGQSSPETVSLAKAVIIKQGGEDAWNALLRVHAQNALDSVKETVTGGVTNLGGRFRQKLFGDPQQRKILQEAMTPDQYENFGRFMDVLDRTGLILGKESTTAPRLVTIGRMQREGFVEPALSWVENLDAMKPGTWVNAKQKIENIREALFSRRNTKLIQAMESPAAARQLQVMLTFKPKSRQMIEALSTFSTMALGDEFAPVVGRDGLLGEQYRRQRIKPTQSGRLTLPQ